MVIKNDGTFDSLLRVSSLFIQSLADLMEDFIQSYRNCELTANIINN